MKEAVCGRGALGWATMGPIVGLGAALLCSHALAQTSVQYQLGSSGVAVVEDALGPVTVSEARSFPSPDGGVSTTSLYAYASYGTLKASAESTTTPPGATNGQSLSNPSFIDQITISNATLNGTIGFLTVPINYSWALLVSGPYATAQVTSRLNFFSQDGPGGAQLELREYQGRNCPTPTTCALTNGFIGTLIMETPDHVLTFEDVDKGPTALVTLPFVFGRTSDLSLSLTAQAASNATVDGEPGRGFTDASHSLYWGGITRITDAAGQDVSAEVISRSGTDYRQGFTSAVPEPASGVLLLAGGLAVAAWRRGGCGI